jgi:Domain of unknown function (DUF4333)
MRWAVPVADRCSGPAPATHESPGTPGLSSYESREPDRICPEILSRSRASGGRPALRRRRIHQSTLSGCERNEKTSSGTQRTTVRTTCACSAPRRGMRSPWHPTKPAGLIAAALLATVCLAACGSSARSLNSAKVERAIAKSIVQERALHATVACPSKVPEAVGHIFTCTAHLDVGTYPVRVAEIDASGHVRYQDPRPLITLNIAKIQQAIEASAFSQRRLRARASCPTEVLQRAGLVFWCTAKIAGDTRRCPFKVSEVDNAGHVRYYGT